MTVLARLINAYPDLKIVALVDSKAFTDSNNYICANVDIDAPHLEYIYRGRKAIYRKICHGNATIFESEVENIPNDPNEYEKMFLEFCKHIKWERVIIIYVDGVADE